VLTQMTLGEHRKKGAMDEGKATYILMQVILHHLTAGAVDTMPVDHSEPKKTFKKP